MISKDRLLCEIANTKDSEQELLSKYQHLVVLINLSVSDGIIDTDMGLEFRDKIKNLIKSNYKHANILNEITEKLNGNS